jgi:hypothetical protein
MATHIWGPPESIPASLVTGLTATQVLYGSSGGGIGQSSQATIDTSTFRYSFGGTASALGGDRQLGIGVSAAGSVFGYIYNANNTGSSKAWQDIRVGGTSAGDAQTSWVVSGTTSWNAGVDNSDSDRFKISNDGSGDLGTSTRFSITTSGVVEIGVGNAVNAAGPLQVNADNNSYHPVAFISNVNAGSSASTGFRASTQTTVAGGDYITLQINGSGFTPSGLLGARTGHLEHYTASSPASILLISNYNNADIVLATNSRSERLRVGSALTVADAINVVVGTTTGTKIGTATTQKLGFFNATPIVQPNTTGTAAGFTANAGTAVNDASTFTGNTGATAYRISDIVRNLKNLGLLAA